MKNSPLACLALLGAAGYITAAGAASLVETRENDGTTSRMLVEGNKARMESEPPDYVLIDLDQRAFLAIDARARQVIDMSQTPPPDPAAQARHASRPAPSAELVPAGEGPQIAGFPTQRYRLVADGRTCAETFLSKEAMTAADMRGFLQRFSDFQRTQKAAYVAAGAEYEVCEEAHEVAMSLYPELGMPLKTVDDDGFLRQEVLSIRTGVVPAMGAFAIPADYRRLSLDEILEHQDGLEDTTDEAIEDEPER